MSLVVASLIAIGGFTIVAFWSAIVVSQVLATLQGTEAEQRLSESIAQERSFESSGFGVHPFNQAVWTWLLDAPDLPDSARDKIRQLRMLRRAMILIVVSIFVAWAVTALQSPHDRVSFKIRA
jgi:hypothetical protein